jgi:AcrR family transcriptional regulator
MGTSLREKKRELLRSTIEKTAVALVLKHGYDNVTVDMICEASLASQRTFFNYFGSKEAAILGPAPSDPDPQISEDFVNQPQGDVLSDLTRMMSRVLSDHGDVDLKLWRDRRAIIRATPQLMKAQTERIEGKDEELVQLVLRRLRTQRAAAGDDVPDDQLTEEARLIVSLWWGIARHAMQLWSEAAAADPTSDPQQIIGDLLILLDRIKKA